MSKRTIIELRSRTPLAFVMLSLMALSPRFFCASPALAQPSTNEKAVADFYCGKTVRIEVGFGASGSFDLTARSIAQTIGKYIPGEPTIIVEKVAGAGSMLVMNRVCNLMPRDLAPGAPEDRVKALQQAMDQTLADPQFVSDMEKIGLVDNPIPRSRRREMIAEILNMPAKAKAELAGIIK